MFHSGKYFLYVFFHVLNSVRLSLKVVAGNLTGNFNTTQNSRSGLSTAICFSIDLCSKLVAKSRAKDVKVVQLVRKEVPVRLGAYKARRVTVGKTGTIKKKVSIGTIGNMAWGHLKNC